MDHNLRANCKLKISSVATFVELLYYFVFIQNYRILTETKLLFVDFITYT